MLYIITENQRLNFKPTYLYIKQHSITGLKYFGKTTRNPYKYNGSGTHWKRHIKKHGKEHVITLWYKLYNDIDELTNTALALSDMFDIVESDTWANLRLEDGLSGGDTFTTNPNKEIIRQKVSITSKHSNSRPERKILQSKIAIETNKNITPEQRKIAGRNISKTKQSEEWKSSHKVSDETKIKQSLSQKIRFAKSEEKVKLSINAKKIWASPSILPKLGINIKVCCLCCNREFNVANFSRHIKRKNY